MSPAQDGIDETGCAGNKVSVEARVDEVSVSGLKAAATFDE